MAHFALCWELGGALGHVGHLLPIAEELARRGHRITFLLRDLAQTEAILRDTPFARLQAPVWLHETVGVPTPQVSMGEILLGIGYLDAGCLRGLATGWANAFRALGADAVVADYAPTAVLAARLVGIPVFASGLGFFLPPDRRPMPPFRTWEPVARGRVEHAEARVLTSVNAVLEGAGRAPIDRLGPLFYGDRSALCTWPELDHYDPALRDHPRYVGPSLGIDGGAAPEWPAGEGPCAFAYLKAEHPEHAAVLRALDAAGLRTVCYLPELAAGMPPPVPSPRIAYSSRPVDLARASADATLVVCHAGEATVARALLAGVPVLALPMQGEQFLVASRLEARGLGLNAARQLRPLNWGAMIDALTRDPAPRAAAHAFAAAHAGFTRDGHTRLLANECEALLRGDGRSA